MENNQLIKNLERVTKQRNTLVIVSSVLLLSNLFLSFVVLNKTQEIILVPGIDEEFRIKGTHISSSYLEACTRMALTGLLDLTPDNILHKKNMVLHTTVAGSIQDISQYFDEKSKQHKEFDLYTYFIEKQPFEIDTEKLSVKAKGMLTISYGRREYEYREAEYFLQFQMIGKILKLKKFTEIIKPQLKGKVGTEEKEAKL